MSLSEERLADIRDRVTAATEGPWAPWLDQDGQPHMNGLLMVGNADAVIPEGESWVEDVDVNPIAHTYTPEDRRFIANARADVPDLLAEVDRLRAGIDAISSVSWGVVHTSWVRHMCDALLNPTEGGN